MPSNRGLDKDVIHTHTHTHTHNGVLLSHERNEIALFAEIRMDLEIVTESEI